ncbi:MAG: beta-propeller fold lactonase family protein [Gordonia sp. (in: high G+C Gram-positive bacteria)]|uniref:lactonase family protein n=1 Tax=Gordonia sp. (in: high G+C Gram-positive bacteria) TaxID=84139 RepID=UPI0039E214E3
MNKQSVGGTSRRGGGPVRALAALATVAALILGLISVPSTATAEPGASQAASSNPKFLVVAGTEMGKVVVLRLLDGGGLRKVSEQSTGNGTMSVKVAQNGRTVFVGNMLDQAIAVYRISDSGRLNPIQKIGVGGVPVTFQPSPDGKYLYVANGLGRLKTLRITDSGRLQDTGHSVDQLNATLAPMVTVDPNSKFVRVASAFEWGIKSYRVGGGGRLIPLGTVSAGITPVNGNTTPDGKFFYIAHEMSMDVRGYRILKDGNLAPIGSWFSGPISHEVQITADGKRAYVPNAGSFNITGWNIGKNGRLTPLPGSPYASDVLTMPALVVLNPNDKYLYAIDVFSPGKLGTTHAHSFRINPNGSLTKIGSTDLGLLVVDGPVAQLAG